MRIAFDGTTLRPARTGVGCYAERLLRHLALTDPDSEFVVLSNRRVDIAPSMPANVRVHDGSRAPVSLAWMQLIAPRLLRQVDADVAHFTNGVIPLGTRVPSVVTIHDMSLTLFPHYHPVRRVLLHRPLVDLAAPAASAIITHSEAAKQDIVRLYELDPGRVHVVHLAAAPEFVPPTEPGAVETIRRRYDLPERFILYVGTIEPRKNLPRLLAAFAAKRRSGDLPLDLVCAGPYGWRARDVARRVEALDLGRAVRFLGYVPLSDLPSLYAASELFVFPSLYEGFGLPVMEAMACGTPVVIGRNGALVEIAGEAAETIDPLDTDALGDALVRLVHDRARRSELAALGLERARQFSWERAAGETLAVYRAAVEAGSPARFPRSPARPMAETPALASASFPAAALAHPDGSADRGPILFGQAYYLRFDPKLWAARQPYPPLGTLYAAAYVREQGYRVAFFDAMLAASEAEWDAALDRERPSVAVLFEDNFNYLSKMCLLRMRSACVEMIRSAGRRRIPVVVAGSDATDHPEIYLNAGADVVVIGEGELTIKQVLDVLQGRGTATLGDVPGLCVRGADGTLVRTRPREPMRDLDRLPLPAWDLVDTRRYREIWHRHHGYLSMNLVTTRGCPYHCNWCAKPIYGQRYAVRSAAHVVAEMAWLKRTYAPDHLWIADDIFGLRPGWLEEFAERVSAAGARIPFKCLMRADQISARTVEALRKAGCRTVWIGAESGSQAVLDAMEKGVRVEQIVSAAGALRAGGIEVGLFLQFGYPGEGRREIEETLEMMRACRPDDIGVSISYPLPGTRFYDRVRPDLGAKRNWFDSNDLETMYPATFSPEFYRVLHRAVHAEFRIARGVTVGALASRPWRLETRHVRHAGAAIASGLKLPLLRWQMEQFSRGARNPPPRAPEAGAPSW